MSADGVEGQGRICRLKLADFAVGYKSELNKRLEAVADTEHKTVAVFEQVVNRVRDSRVAEGCGDKLARAVGLVTAGEAAGNHNHLRFSDDFFHSLYSFLNAALGEVLNNQKLCLSACLFERAGGVYLAVCAREYGDKYLRLCDLNCRSCNVARVVKLSVNLDFGTFRLSREYLFERSSPLVEHVLKLYALAAHGDFCVIGNGAEVVAQNIAVKLCAVLKLEHERAGKRSEKLLICELLGKLKAEAVAERRLAYAGSRAALLDYRSGKHLAALHQRVNRLVHLDKLVPFGHKCRFIFRNGNVDYL